MRPPPCPQLHHPALHLLHQRRWSPRHHHPAGTGRTRRPRCPGWCTAAGPRKSFGAAGRSQAGRSGCRPQAGAARHPAAIPQPARCRFLQLTPAAGSAPARAAGTPASLPPPPDWHETVLQLLCRPCWPPPRSQTCAGNTVRAIVRADWARCTPTAAQAGQASVHCCARRNLRTCQ